MSDIVGDMVRRLLHREPTAEDYKRVDRLVRDLPPEIVSSPGAMAEVVLRAEHVRQLEEVVRQASFDAQQRIHHDLGERVDRAALAALAKIRDRMPIDSSDRTTRLLRMIAVWTVIVVVMVAPASWTLAVRSVSADRQTHHAAAETAFGRCIDAATGGFTDRARADGKSAEPSRHVVRNDLMICAAEYADRRAGDR